MTAKKIISTILIFINRHKWLLLCIGFWLISARDVWVREYTRAIDLFSFGMLCCYIHRLTKDRTQKFYSELLKAIDILQKEQQRQK